MNKLNTIITLALLLTASFAVLAAVSEDSEAAGGEVYGTSGIDGAVQIKFDADGGSGGYSQWAI